MPYGWFSTRFLGFGTTSSFLPDGEAFPVPKNIGTKLRPMGSSLKSFIQYRKPPMWRIGGSGRPGFDRQCAADLPGDGKGAPVQILGQYSSSARARGSVRRLRVERWNILLRARNAGRLSVTDELGMEDHQRSRERHEVTLVARDGDAVSNAGLAACVNR
jgi:hypothetical protein